jgi:hypothetical protein
MVGDGKEKAGQNRAFPLEMKDGISKSKAPGYNPNKGTPERREITDEQLEEEVA